MSRQKLNRFDDLKNRHNVIEHGDNRIVGIKSKWGTEIFNNQNPINLELACGRGEYAIGLAKNFPDENFVGVDIKGERLWQASSKAIEENLTNVAFARHFILDLEEMFAEGEIKDIWIIHPDPRPRDRDEKRRLTFHRFLEIYKRIQGGTGKIHLKTDNTQLYEWTLNEVIPERTDIENLHFTDDLHNSVYLEEHYGISTRYERKFAKKGETIKYLRFTWKA